MPGQVPKKYRLGVAALAALTAAVALAGCSDARPSGDGCANDHDRQRAQSLASLPFITAHPDPAEVVDQGGGCGSDSGQIGAGREYYWENLDQRGVAAFHRAIAMQDGWTVVPAPAESQAASNAARDPDADLGAARPSTLSEDDDLCFTKTIDGSAAFMQLEFPDSSIHGAYGNVYTVSAWFPGPSESPGC
ncbi:hypothetical protein [Krasilnikovia sp. M28-CT-15]|uniref:hypothetical protein n=1 Tax=Krasilnikovia sp. M28-CT-15 TaxID=3373540 RepID=UPI00399CC54B